MQLSPISAQGQFIRCYKSTSSLFFNLFPPPGPVKPNVYKPCAIPSFGDISIINAFRGNLVCFFAFPRLVNYLLFPYSIARPWLVRIIHLSNLDKPDKICYTCP
jgi:hypothetical protein